MLNLLNSIMKNTESELKREVVATLIDNFDEDFTSNTEVIDYLRDIVTYGCSSGIVYSLIYTSETEAFFDKFADEIFDLYNESVKEFGQFDMELNKNNLAWFAFEEITYSVLNELEDAYSFISDEDGNEY